MRDKSHTKNNKCLFPVTPVVLPVKLHACDAKQYYM